MFLGPTARLSHGVGDNLFCAHTGHTGHEYSQRKRLLGRHGVGELGRVLGRGRILWVIFIACAVLSCIQIVQEGGYCCLVTSKAQQSPVCMYVHYIQSASIQYWASIMTYSVL